MATRYAANIRQITASANALDPPVAALYFGVSGTIDVTNQDGTTQAGVQVFAGTTIICSPAKITAISGATVYGIYDK